MTYLEQRPTEQLDSFIDRFWYCQAHDLSHKAMSIPLLHHELVLNFSEHYAVKRSSEKKSIAKNPRSWISGIQTESVISESSGYHEMMGVLFKPNGLRAFIPYSSIEFKNMFVGADLIFDQHFVSLQDQIHNTDEPVAKINLLEQYLLDQLCDRKLPGYLNASLSLLDQTNHTRSSIKDICTQLSISNKSLIQAYQKHVGVTPNKYMQLRSINSAIQSLSKNPRQSLTQLTYELDFYDQAHFAHSFKSITGLTPSEYARHVLNDQADTDTPNFISL